MSTTHYTATSTAIECPVCRRCVFALQPVVIGGAVRHLCLPEHTDVREAVLEQPRCTGSHTILSLVDLQPLREARARIKGVACGYDREESRCFDQVDALLKKHPEVPRG